MVDGRRARGEPHGVIARRQIGFGLGREAIEQKTEQTHRAGDAPRQTRFMRGDMQGYAQGAVGMKAAREQHHGLGGRGQRQAVRGHAVVAGELDARHRRQLRGGQKAAMTLGHVVENALAHRGRHAGVPLRLLRGVAHVGLRQIDPDHRHPGAHRGHHRRGVHGPRPAVVVPAQPGAYDGFGRIARAVETLTSVGHLQCECGKLSALAQRADNPRLHRVMIGMIMLLAQHAQRGTCAVVHQLLRRDELPTALQDAPDQRRVRLDRLGVARQRRQGSGPRCGGRKPKGRTGRQTERDIQTPSRGVGV